MKSDLDALADEITRAAKLQGVGNTRLAGASGTAVTVPSSTIISGGVPQQEWLVGDDFSDRFYFKDYLNAEETI